MLISMNVNFPLIGYLGIAEWFDEDRRFLKDLTYTLVRVNCKGDLASQQQTKA